jgi:hypothetical protein
LNVNPEVAEAADVEATRSLTERVLAIHEPRLLMARMDWEKLFSSANPPGAVAPGMARETLTRQANRRKEQRRRALRSGNAGFLRSLAALT